MEVGERIREARERLGWSQKRLAEEAGKLVSPPRTLSQVAIKKIESGDTERSKFLNEVLRAVGLGAVQGPVVNHQALTIEEKNLVGDRDFPVHSLAEGGKGALVLSSEPVDYVRRPEPLQNVRSGYGILIAGESMVPAFKPGDTALVHPHLPLVAGCDVVLYSEADGEVRATIKELRRYNDTTWYLTQHNPQKDFTLSRRDWQKCHRIVGKYSRR
jgi:phage repressor protein C with HTH and peptisase S24 domain